MGSISRMPPGTRHAYQTAGSVHFPAEYMAALLTPSKATRTAHCVWLSAARWECGCFVPDVNA